MAAPAAPPDPAAAADAAAMVARDSYGRLLAWLAWRWRDLAAAEDALAEALASALQTWPRTGVPASPDAWLMTAAKRNLLQMNRHDRVVNDPAVTLLLAVDEEAPEAEQVPDQRLKLLFVCAHPAVDASVRTALMLQTVLGLEAKQIAAAFLVSPSAMAQRLVRAKAKIAAAGIAFEEPETSDLPERIHAVLEAIYAAYGLGWDGSDMAAAERTDLTNEALYLSELTHALLPDSAEAAGLRALLLLCESRRRARFAPDGAFVPLHEQDTHLWDVDLIRRADQLLWHASSRRTPGPFQLEAAIQAAHCHRVFTGTVPWTGIAQLYAHLVRLAPTLGAQVGHAVAVGEAGAPADGLALLDAIAADKSAAQALGSYQPYWVARAHLLARTGQQAPARDSYERAVGLTTLPAIRRHLQSRLQTLDAR
ncbi:DUF6596 domain-containing protein [Polaromonas sp. YR568]|uniref:RNA polymerase sigma factor n=1 Tax=Polaromonas sp. YR568 TaxID=1855301 RepID=UPI0031381041